MTPEQIILFQKHNTHAYHAITVEDEYRLGQIETPPRIVFDIGANVGIFTTVVKDRWPEAKVIAVEPHPGNFQVLAKTVGSLPGVELLCAALAKSDVYFRPGKNSGGHIYRSDSIGEAVDMPIVMLDALANRFGQPDLIKIDIEGAEAVLIGHEPSRAVLQATDTITIELHPWGKDRPSAYQTGTAMLSWLASFFDTHDIELWLKQTAGMIWMKKRT